MSSETGSKPGAPAAPEGAAGPAGNDAPPLPNPSVGAASVSGSAAGGGAAAAAGAGADAMVKPRTAGFTGGTRATTAAGSLVSLAEGPAMRVYPPVVEFHGVEVGTVYSIVVVVQNGSQRSRRLRVVQPKSSAFTLNWTPVGTVAPGLDVKAEIEFKATEERPYHDTLLIMSGDERVEVPLHAFVPAPDVTFDGFVNLGVVVVENVQAKVVEFRNEGHRPGRFKITYDKDLPITITPTEGVLAPRGKFVDADADGVMEQDEFITGGAGDYTENVKVELNAEELGVFRALATVELEGQASRVLDINATVVEQRLEMVLPDGGGPMTDLHFGTLFHGQQRTVTALLVNNGPVSLSYSLTLSNKDAPVRDPFDEDEGSAADEEFCPITVLPLEGSLEPYAQVPITFSFRPENTEKPPTFKSLQSTEATVVPTQYEMTALVECAENGQVIEVDVSAAAAKPQVELSQKSFKFGECAVGERRDVLLKVKNPGDALPVEWSCKGVANFRIAPARGRLQPLQSQNVIVTFAPGQMGRFQNVLHLVVGNGILTMPLRVSGTSSSPGHKKLTTKGKAAPPSAFKPTFHFVQAPDELDVPVAGATKAPESTFARPLPWEELTKGDQDLSVPTEALYTFSVQEMEARSAHRNQYNSYLTKARKARERTKRLAADRAGDLRWDDPVNLGMDSHAGLSEPALKPPVTVDPLWLQRPLGEDGLPAGGPSAGRKIPVDENRLIKKKFKPKPTTAAEVSDCTTLLSVQELSQVAATPRVLNFGQVSVDSVNKKNFAVTNDLAQSVVVSLTVNCEELSETGPLSQVIPPGSVAGFDVTLHARHATDLKVGVTYVINEAHAFKFQVLASVVPTVVEVSPPRCVMMFPESSLDAEINDTVTLTNPGNAEAHYRWDVPAGAAFRVEPSSGTIAPFKTQDAIVTFHPTLGSTNEVVLSVLADGADTDVPPPSLHCVGECEEPKVSFQEKKFEFGNMAVGVARERVATMKNTGAVPAVYWTETTVPGVTLNPARGRVLAGATADLTLKLQAMTPQVYDERRHFVNVHVRGARSLRLPISAATVVPDVRLTQDEYEFGKVTVGSSMRARVTVENKGVIPAVLVIDMSKHPQFSVAMPLLEDDASVGDESVFVPLDGTESMLGDGAGSELSNDDEIVQKASRFKLTVAASAFLPFDLVFAPTSARTHAFELPLSLLGMEPSSALRRTVTAEGVEPRLLVSKTEINFDNKIVARDHIKKVPYHMEVTLTNAEDEPLAWETDCSKLERGHLAGVFRLDPPAGNLRPGEFTTMRVSFLPNDSREYSCIIPLFLDGDKSRPYVELAISGTGMYAQLTFDRREVVLPVVPLGETATATFHVLNCGYDHLDLKVKMPAESSPARVPLEVSFPDGQTVGIAKQKLPVEVKFTSKKAMAFTCNVDFLDEEGNKFSLPVTGTTDNSLLTTYPYIETVRDTHQWYAPPQGGVSLLDRDAVALAEIAARKARDKAARRAARAAGSGGGASGVRSNASVVSGSAESKSGESAAKAAAAAVGGKRSSASSAAGASVAGAGAGAGPGAAGGGADGGDGAPGSSGSGRIDALPNPPISAASIAILMRYLNNNLFRSPVEDFPADIVNVHGRPVFEMIELLAGKGVPGRLHRTNPHPREQTVQLLGQYRELLTYLKQHGALLHHVRPEQLLKKDYYTRVRTSRRGHFGANYGDIVVGHLEPSKMLALKRKADKEYPAISLEAWSTVILQVVKVFVLSRVNLKQFATLPGMEPGAATDPLPPIGAAPPAPPGEAAAAAGAGAGGGGGAAAGSSGASGSGVSASGSASGSAAGAARGRPRSQAVEEKKGEDAAEAEAAKKRKKPRVDPTLSGSNIHSQAEAILLKWLTYHHNKVNPNNALRVVDFSSDLRDGVVLAMALLSHAPALALKGRALFEFNRNPVSDEDVKANTDAVVRAIRELGLEPPLTAEEIRGNSDDFAGFGGLSDLGSAADAGSAAGAAGGLGGGGGAAVEAAVVKDVGSGNSRDMMLCVMHLYQTLPQLIPKTQIDFEGALGHTVLKTIELRNPSKRPISYTVSLDGAQEFKIGTNSLRLEPDTIASFPIECTSRFSAPCEARLTFRSKREGGAAAATMVFNLRSVVHSRPPVDTVSLTTPQYVPVNFEVEVRNPYPEDAFFKLTLNQEKIEAPGGRRGKGKGRGNAKGGARGGGRPPRRSTKAGSGASGAGGGASGEPTVTPPNPFFLRKEEIRVHPGGHAKVPVQFLPVQQGKYKCQLVCLDESQGEFVYDILGESTLADTLETFKYKCEAKPSVQRDFVLPFRNGALGAAEKTFQERRAVATARTTRIASRVKGPVGRASAGSRAGAAMLAPQRKTLFTVEVNSPYFEVPAEIALEPESAHAKTPRTAGTATAPGTAPDTAGKRHARKDGALLETPRGGERANTLPLTFHPKAPGTYEAKLVLRSKSGFDTRVYELEFQCTQPGVDRELEFAAPARQSITQEIPVVNGTDEDWNLGANIAGSASFTGPSNLRVPAKGQAAYQLTFEPEAATHEKGTLTLANRATGDSMKFELKGVGEEPLAEDHIVITCQARDTVKHVFVVRNNEDEPVIYAVESDLPHVSGPSTITVDEHDEEEYELTIVPQLGGTYSGQVTFLAPDGNFQWYTVEVQASAPDPEDKLSISSFVRRAVSVEISLGNPLEEPVEFEVTLHGEGLIGDPVFVLGPSETATYELLYSPLTPGAQLGSVTFVNERVGEFWYELDLRADPAPPTQLEDMTAPVGSSSSQRIKLENPTGEEVVIKHSVDNRRNFAVTPASVVLAPYSEGYATVEYTPSSIGEAEAGTLTLMSPALGEWVYNVTGSGTIPGEMPSVEITAPAGQQTSASITFRNPFAKPLQLVLSLAIDGKLVNPGGPSAAVGARSPARGKGKGTQRGPAPILQLLKKSRNVVPPFAGINVPFSFAPPQIAETPATLIIEAPDRKLGWTYPIRAIAEAPPSDRVLEYEAQARASEQFDLELVLAGQASVDPADEFTHEIVVPDEYKVLVNRSLVVEAVNTSIEDVDSPLRFKVTFEPLRPFAANCEFVVNKRSGGRWRFDMRLVATEPEPDDIIHVEALLHHTSSVAFNLTNQFATYAPFKASFTLESPSELEVHPDEGMLPPLGSEGTTFVVSFTPREYGKELVGKLIIETEDMRWSYEVRGSHPTYKAPQARSRIDQKLDKKVEKALVRTGEPRNIMRANMNVTRNARKIGHGGAAVAAGAGRK